VTIAFVLQGGASLAAAQVGMLRALTAAGIRPDLVIGTSAGALNAVGFAQNPTPEGLDELGRLWMSVRRGDVLHLSARSLITGLTGRSDSLAVPDRLRTLVERGLHVRDLGDTAIPAYVVATDAATSTPVVLSEGSAVEALVASSSIPGILPPVRRDGRLLVDGGVSADVPILQAEALGATTSYVLPAQFTTTPGAPATGAVPVLLRTLGRMLEGSTVRDLAAARGEVRVLPSPSLPGPNPLDFRRTAEYIRLGQESAARWLAGLLDGVAAEARRPGSPDPAGPLPQPDGSSRGRRAAAADVDLENDLRIPRASWTVFRPVVRLFGL
jgi:NTE family protein